MTKKKETAAPEEGAEERAARVASPDPRSFPGSDEIMQYEGLLKLSAPELADRIAEDHDSPIPEEKVAGLLGLERSGQNRTDHVKVLMDRLGIASPYEVTNAGPAFTNDTTPVTELKR